MKAKLVEHRIYQEDRRFKNNWSMELTYLADDGTRFTNRFHLGPKENLEKELKDLETVDVSITCRFDGTSYVTDYKYVRYDYYASTNYKKEYEQNGYFTSRESAFNELVQRELAKMEEAKKKILALTAKNTYENQRES